MSECLSPKPRGYSEIKAFVKACEPKQRAQRRKSILQITDKLVNEDILGEYLGSILRSFSVSLFMSVH